MTPILKPTDFAAILPGVGVFGGVRRFIEIGNELVSRGHRYTLYHPEGGAPQWLPFQGSTRKLSDLASHEHSVLLCSDPAMLPEFSSARAEQKFFYCVLEKLSREREIVCSKEWRILANSTGIQERLWKKYRVRAIPVIGGLNPGIFHRGSHSGESAGADHMQARSRLRVLAYGRTSRKRKGTSLVIRAVETAAKRIQSHTGQREPLQLVLFDHVGPGNEHDPRQDFTCRVPYEFHINENQENLARLYAGCDLFINAERRAGWNNTVAEAMACGTPVICTPSGTIDLATHKQTAWVVRWRHSWFFARALFHLSQNPALREILARNALERVKHVTWVQVVNALEKCVASGNPF